MSDANVQPANAGKGVLCEPATLRWIGTATLPCDKLALLPGTEAGRLRGCAWRSIRPVLVGPRGQGPRSPAVCARAA